MNKELFTLLEATAKELNNTLDKESQRYLDRCIKERRLDGAILMTLANLNFIAFLIFSSLNFKASIWMIQLDKRLKISRRKFRIYKWSFPKIALKNLLN